MSSGRVGGVSALMPNKALLCLGALPLMLRPAQISGKRFQPSTQDLAHLYEKIVTFTPNDRANCAL